MKLIVMRSRKWVTKSEQVVKHFLKEFDSPEQLAPHQALYGRRMAALQLKYSEGSDKCVQYVYVTFLYPYVN